MKRYGKSSAPIIAAHAKKNNGHNGTTAKMKSLVLERISDGILAFDVGMNHVYVNERAGEILGREPQSLLGKNFWDEYPESAGSPFADACQRAFETQTIVPFDGYFPPSETRFEGRVYPSSDGLSVLISNDTPRKQAGNLDVSQFLAQNPNPVMRFTRDGKLLYANPASAPLLAPWKGQKEQELPVQFQELLSAVMETNSNKEIEIENQGKTYSCLLVPLRESGYLDLYFIDITERKQGERTLMEFARQQTALYKLVDQLHRSNTLEDVFHSSLAAITNALQCDRASILLFDETRIMHFVAWRGLSDEYRKATDGHSPWKYGEINPAPICHNDIDSSDLSDSLKAVIKKEGIRSLAFIPLVFQEKLIGKFMVYFNTPHDFSGSELDLSLTIGRQLASSVDRKRAEEALQQSEERFARFMQYLPGLAWIKDVHGRYVYANLAAEKAFNTPQEKLYGRTDQEIFPATAASQFRQHDEQALLEGRGVQVVEMLEQDDGVLHHSLVTKFPILGPDGKTALIGGTAFDITERIQIEQALRQAHEHAEEAADRMARLQEVTASLAGSADLGQLTKLVLEQGTQAAGAATGIMVEVLKNGQELKTIAALGHPAGTVRMQPLALSEPTPMSDCIRTRQAIWIESQEEFAAQYPDLAEVRHNVGIEATVSLPLIVGDRTLGGLAFSFKEQREFLLEERGFFLAVAQQCAQGLERARAEEELRQSRERYQNLFDLVPIAVYTCDADGRIQEYNRRAVELWGREPQINDPEEKYCGSFKIYYPDGRFMPHATCPMARMLRGETLEPHEFEILVERRDGSWRNVIAHPLAIRNEQGEIIGAINCLYDMTERQQAEDRLALLAEVSELTRNMEGPEDLMSAVADVVGRHLKVQRCLFNEIDMQNDREIVHHDFHQGTQSVAGVHKITDYSSITSAEMAEGKTVVNTDSKLDPRTADDYERSYLPNGERAYIAVPLMRNEHWVASLWVSDDAPRQWDQEEVSLVEAVAERTWIATEKLRINAALRDSEERYRAIINQTTVGIVRKDADGNLIFVNQAFGEMVGRHSSELLGTSMWQLTHPDDVSRNRELYNHLMAEGIPFQFEKRLIHRDGSILWARVSVSPLLDAEGKPQSAVSVYSDITLRRLAEAELKRLNLELEERVQQRTAELEAANDYLRESEATARLILESMPDAILIADKDGRVVYGNTQVESLFGYSPEEVIGQPVEMLIPERFHEKHMEHRHEYSGQRQRRSMGLSRDMFGQRKDNSEFPVDVMLSPISNNTSWDVMITIRDNTEQKQVQQALRTNEEKLRKLFEILPVGVSFLDNEGQVTELNSALSRILGLSKRELLERKFKPRQYIRSDGSPMPSSEFASVRAHTNQKTVYNVETGIIKENGDTIWTSVNAAPVDIADVDIVVTTIDITERKKAEDALHKNRERLRILSRRLVEVQEEERRALARELHDRVGQNLAALNLNLNILRGQLSTDALQVIGSRLDDSVTLVNQILTITRSVMSDLRSNVLDDYGLESALREFAEQFTLRTGVQVVTDKQVASLPRLDASIEMTLLRIAQEALTNVARHAQAKQATVSIRVEADAVDMSIQDDGIGILSWQRANQPGNHGLQIIRERAEAFGGSLQIHSTYKKGTRVEVKIPLVNVKGTREKRS